MCEEKSMILKRFKIAFKLDKSLNDIITLKVRKFGNFSYFLMAWLLLIQESVQEIHHS